MYIHQLKLQNFKGYKELELILNGSGGITVLYGMNASGKTSILEALGVAAAFFTCNILPQGFPVILQNQIRLEKNGLPYPEYQYPVVINVKGTIDKEKIEWTTKKEKQKPDTIVSFQVKTQPYYHRR